VERYESPTPKHGPDREARAARRPADGSVHCPDMPAARVLTPPAARRLSADTCPAQQSRDYLAELS